MKHIITAVLLALAIAAGLLLPEVFMEWQDRELETPQLVSVTEPTLDWDSGEGVRQDAAAAPFLSSGSCKRKQGCYNNKKYLVGFSGKSGKLLCVFNASDHYTTKSMDEFEVSPLTTNSSNILGVIGGLGPVATAHFMELVIRMTEARTDQEHLEMIIYNTPSTPDRTAHILDHTKPDPLPDMIRIGQRLASQNVSCIAIPCFTAHYFFAELCEAIPVPILNALEATARYLKAAGVRRAGIMATDGTIRTGLFRRELEKVGIQAVLPSPEGQKKVMSLIYDDIKQNRPADMEKFTQVRQELLERGAEVIILGCTELSMIKRDNAIGPGFLDAMEVLAATAVTACGGRLSRRGTDLIT